MILLVLFYSHVLSSIIDRIRGGGWNRLSQALDVFTKKLLVKLTGQCGGWTIVFLVLRGFKLWDNLPVCVCVFVGPPALHFSGFVSALFVRMSKSVLGPPNFQIFCRLSSLFTAKTLTPPPFSVLTAGKQQQHIMAVSSREVPSTFL